MTERTAIEFSQSSGVGVVAGSWTTPAAGRRKILAVNYPVLVASIGPELKTDTFSVTARAIFSGARRCKLRRSLPTARELARAINAATAKAFEPLRAATSFVAERADGWYWENPIGEKVKVDLRNAQTHQAFLGYTEGGPAFTIPANGRVGPFEPDLRLGATSQRLTISSTQGHTSTSQSREMWATGFYLDPLTK